MPHRNQLIRMGRRILLQQCDGLDLSSYSTKEILSVPLRTIEQFTGYRVTDEMLQRQDYTPGQIVRWADGAVFYSSHRLMSKAVESLDQLNAHETLLVVLNGGWGPYPPPSDDRAERRQREFEESRDRRDSCVQHLIKSLKACEKKELVSLLKEIGSLKRVSIDRRYAARIVLPEFLERDPTLEDLLSLTPIINVATSGTGNDRQSQKTDVDIEEIFVSAAKKHIVKLSGENCLTLLHTHTPPLLRGAIAYNCESTGTFLIRKLLLECIAKKWGDKPIKELLSLVVQTEDLEIQDLLFSERAPKKKLAQRFSELKKLAYIA